MLLQIRLSILFHLTTCYITLLEVLNSHLTEPNQNIPTERIRT
jgi:hypothetical protein